MYTYPHEPDEGYAGSWTYSFREPDETSGICFLPNVQYKGGHRFPSSKIKQQDEDVIEIATEIKV